MELVLQGRAGSEMWGFLLVPSSSPTLPPIYDGLDVNVTSNVTWFNLNHDMVSRRIYISYPSTEGTPLQDPPAPAVPLVTYAKGERAHSSSGLEK